MMMSGGIFGGCQRSSDEHMCLHVQAQEVYREKVQSCPVLLTDTKAMYPYTVQLRAVLCLSRIRNVTPARGR